jgi:hypothetical protein
MSTTPLSTTIQIRGARTDDARTILRLAALDSTRPFDGAALIAEIDGRPQAAMSLATGKVVADPFARTAELVDMLEVHRRAIAAREARAARAAAATPALGQSAALAA